MIPNRLGRTGLGRDGNLPINRWDSVEQRPSLGTNDGWVLKKGPVIRVPQNGLGGNGNVMGKNRFEYGNIYIYVI